jgi:hypothetical protein
MQLPPREELVLVSACHPIRAKKARYYEDVRFNARVFHHPRWPSPARAPPAVDPIEELTTGAISRLQRQSMMRLGRSPTLSLRIPTMAASAVSRHYPTTKRSRPRSASPAQSSLSRMMSLTMTPSVPEHCGSASAQWRDRPRSIQMTEFRSKDRL